MINVNGFRSGRLYRHMTIQQMAEQAGISISDVRHCETGAVESVTMLRVLALAETMGITITEGLYEESVDDVCRFPLRLDLLTILDIYMHEKCYSCKHVANILGVSQQTVYVQRAKLVPDDKYLRKLAEHEGVSVDEFLVMYSEAEVKL